MYDDFYGFSGRPFQLTPDPAFYFESATHRKALSYLGYGLGQGEGFVVVTGEVGAGKSTLVAHLMQTIDRQRLTAGQIVTSALDGAELVHVAAQAFGLSVAGKDKAGALQAIESFLHAEARAGRRCLLVVDEAQSLTQPALEELRMLSNFQLGAHPLLQILLLGQPEFRATLAHDPALEQLRQRVIATHHLEAMTPDEVGAYIEHRLSKVGWSGNPAFDREVYLALADATGGIPRRVNQVVSRLLLLGAVERAERIDGALLAATLDDMARDGAAPEPAAKAAEPEAVVAFPPRQARHAEADGASREEIVAAFGERDALIVELQQAVIELSEAIAHGPAPAAPAGDSLLAGALAALEQRVGAIENRLFEQEQTLRHTLTMLIEWIEDDPQARAA